MHPLKKLYIFFVFLAITANSAYSQFYSGKFISTPQMEDFDHMIIHQHPHHHKYGGDLSIKAFIPQGELWHSTARLLDDEKATAITNKFAKGKEILSVYELDIELDGEEWEYFLLGYKDQNDKGQFIVIEEIFDIEDKSNPIEINLFEWKRKEHHQAKGL